MHRIQDRDAVALATCRALDAAEPVSEASAATAALWTVPAPKPFLIFELEALSRESYLVRSGAQYAAEEGGAAAGEL